MNLINLKRWIKASIVKAIEDQKLNYLNFQPIEIFVEGDDRLTNKETEYLEFRLDGPYSKPITKGEYHHYIELNILVQGTRNESNSYRFDNLQGLASQILNRDWCIFKIGNVGKNPEDDESLLGVMQMLPSDNIKLSDFGRIDDNVETYAASVEAHYEMYTRS
jgi:hypothetical protein